MTINTKQSNACGSNRGRGEYDISVANAELCAITVNGVQHIVPYPIAKLISDLAEQIGKEQEDAGREKVRKYAVFGLRQFAVF